MREAGKLRGKLRTPGDFTVNGNEINEPSTGANRHRRGERSSQPAPEGEGEGRALMRRGFLRAACCSSIRPETMLMMTAITKTTATIMITRATRCGPDFTSGTCRFWIT